MLRLSIGVGEAEPRGYSNTGGIWVRTKREQIPLTLAHEIAHGKLGHNGKFSGDYAAHIQASELAAWLLAFYGIGNRKHIKFAAKCLATYHVRNALSLLQEGCKRLGIPK